MIATYPVGGVAWDYGQYALGLEALGYEVWYLEDTGMQTYDPAAGEYGSDASYGVQFLARSLASFSATLGARWHFRDQQGKTYGIGKEQLHQILSAADLFLNVSGCTLLRDEYMHCPLKVLIDTDPGYNHFVNYPRWDRGEGWPATHGFRGHDRFFTYAVCLGHPECLLPTFDLDWLPTLPPVMLDRWVARPPGRKWTTVMTWNNFTKPIVVGERTFGTKEMEFPRIEALPSRLPDAKFELAVGGTAPPLGRWKDLGWCVESSEAVSRTLADYQTYVATSRGEISVAKNLYTATHSGWFSCRSVCYLAAGRPVVVQDTGFSKRLPTGAGLFAFNDLEGAEEGVAAVEADYELHSAVAQNLAREHFAAEVVLGQLLADAGVR